jgi:phosphatidylserine synthase
MPPSWKMIDGALDALDGVIARTVEADAAIGTTV